MHSEGGGGGGGRSLGLKTRPLNRTTRGVDNAKNLDTICECSPGTCLTGTKNAQAEISSNGLVLRGAVEFRGSLSQLV